MFRFMSFTPGLGQSVPHSTRSAISGRRGKYSNNLAGGIPDTSSLTCGCRRRMKNASSMYSGRPPCAITSCRSGKSIATSSSSIGLPYLDRAPGNTLVPVCTITGSPRCSARR